MERAEPRAFHVTVGATIIPAWERHWEVVRNDLTAVKAALLYADRVTLISYQACCTSKHYIKAWSSLTPEDQREHVIDAMINGVAPPGFDPAEIDSVRDKMKRYAAI